MGKHITHYATFKVRFNLTYLDPSFRAAYCFSRVISVPRFSVCVSSSVADHFNFTVRDRLLEDIRLSVVDSVLNDDKTASDFHFLSEQLDYSFRAKDFLSGLMFRGSSKFTFDSLHYLPNRDKPISPVPVEVVGLVRFSVSHIKSYGV